MSPTFSPTMGSEAKQQMPQRHSSALAKPSQDASPSLQDIWDEQDSLKALVVAEVVCKNVIISLLTDTERLHTLPHLAYWVRIHLSVKNPKHESIRKKCFKFHTVIFILPLSLVYQCTAPVQVAKMKAKIHEEGVGFVHLWRVGFTFFCVAQFFRVDPVGWFAISLGTFNSLPLGLQKSRKSTKDRSPRSVTRNTLVVTMGVSWTVTV